MMETERHRDQFREETLAVLKGQGDEKKYTEMVRVFAREKRQAEKMIQQMLTDYVPRPLPRRSPTTAIGKPQICRLSRHLVETKAQKAI